jgi:hypothetical protein
MEGKNTSSAHLRNNIVVIKAFDCEMIKIFCSSYPKRLNPHPSSLGRR